MQTVEQLRVSLSGTRPPTGLDLALQALWWAARGDWEQAHACAQAGEGDGGCDWVHAHLHRREGDLANARYWYRRAGRPECREALDGEWSVIASVLLAAPGLASPGSRAG